MPPDPWTAFTFFGIPFVLGLLGVHAGGRRCYRAYRRWTADRPVRDEDDRSVREQAAIGGVLVLGAGGLVAHAGRWLLRLYL